ncbi:DUF6090 family protein [Salinimicrobium sp. HB62]|uniref:DUF6090 family protein n=1 Tax=Salinimicrobium sp. HB62 TaxID=3077781 RepID=UPI002D79430E|nr:DUF6090 family protein [Salinimicrobium sp. HB62]
MIKFFRRIRQNLLTENKFSKYFLYAVGEIVLVVIGILIALAINNRNQNRIIREKEQVYLMGLKEEFQTSKRKLEELMEVNRRNFIGAKQVVSYISTDTRPSEKELSELLYHTFSSDISFNPNNSLLIEMINSGSLKDISNTTLRARLTNWISTIEDISKQENDLGLQRELVLDFLRRNDYSLRAILEDTGVSRELDLPQAASTKSNLELLNSTAFENNVLMFILSSHATEEAHYKPLLKNLNTILVLIDDEIE